MQHRRLSLVILISILILLAIVVILAPAANAPIVRPVSPLVLQSPINNVTLTPLSYLPLVVCDSGCPTATPTPTPTVTPTATSTQRPPP